MKYSRHFNTTIQGHICFIDKTKGLISIYSSKALQRIGYIVLLQQLSGLEKITA